MNLTKDEQYILYDWIDRYVLPSKNMNYDASTDRLRASFELYYIKEFHVSNNDMNEALRNEGYKAGNPDRFFNNFFGISVKFSNIKPSVK